MKYPRLWVEEKSGIPVFSWDRFIFERVPHRVVFPDSPTPERMLAAREFRTGTPVDFDPFQMDTLEQWLEQDVLVSGNG